MLIIDVSCDKTMRLWLCRVVITRFVTKTLCQIIRPKTPKQVSRYTESRCNIESSPLTQFSLPNSKLSFNDEMSNVTSSGFITPRLSKKISIERDPCTKSLVVTKPKTPRAACCASCEQSWRYTQKQFLYFSSAAPEEVELSWLIRCVHAETHTIIIWVWVVIIKK
jgi:hypothetical protein